MGDEGSESGFSACVMSSDEDDDNDTFAQLLVVNQAVHNRHNIVMLLTNANISSNFPGSNVKKLQQLLWLHHHNLLPRRHYFVIEATRRDKQHYLQLLQNVTLQQLANLLTMEEQTHYRKHGWLKLSIQFTEVELNLVTVLKALQAAELGVVTTDPSTFGNARMRTGYDSTYGWVRSPAMSPMHFYLASHPRIYKFHAAILALTLLDLGYDSEDENAVRVCLELKLQTYNTKFLPPAREKTQFCHIDGNYKRDGISRLAPQCIVALSPSTHCTTDGTPMEIFGCNFIDLNQHREKWEGEVSQSLEPYVFPREAVVAEHAGAVPEFARHPNYKQAAHEGALNPKLTSGPTDVQTGDVLLFGTLTAHEFTQHAVLRGHEGDEEVPDAWTRYGEYPMLVATRAIGVPNQSHAETAAAACTGRSARSWSHVHTGNRQTNTGNHLEFVNPPLGISAHSALARCLLGVDAWESTPRAIEWLCNQAAGKAEELRIVCEAEHHAFAQRLINGAIERLHDLAGANVVASAVAEWHHCQGYAQSALTGPDRSVARAAKRASSIAMKIADDCAVDAATQGECETVLAAAQHRRELYETSMRDFERVHAEVTKRVRQGSERNMKQSRTSLGKRPVSDPASSSTADADAPVVADPADEADDEAAADTANPQGAQHTARAAAAAAAADQVAPEDFERLRKAIMERDYGCKRVASASEVKAAKEEAHRRCAAAGLETPMVCWDDGRLSSGYRIVCAPDELRSKNKLCTGLLRVSRITQMRMQLLERSLECIPFKAGMRQAYLMTASAAEQRQRIAERLTRDLMVKLAFGHKEEQWHSLLRKAVFGDEGEPQSAASMTDAELWANCVTDPMPMGRSSTSRARRTQV